MWLVLDEPGGARVHLPEHGETGLTIGRDPSCPVRVPFDDTLVSRRHAQIEWAGPSTWWVTDLCSSNGTFVSGRRVEEAVLVVAGQFLQVGQTVFRLDVDERPVDE